MRKFKRDIIKTIFAFLVFLAFFAFFVKRIRLPLNESTSFSKPALEVGVVTFVYDGDTFEVRFKDGLEKKVRLIGIDAPEIDDHREDVKFWAHMAKRFSFYYLFQKEIRLSYDWELEDNYGRLLAYIWTENGLFNDFILREGFAFVFLKFPFRKDYQKRFRESEEFARENERGLWKKGSFPQIRSQDAKYHLGELLSVEYRCSSQEIRSQFLFLHSSYRGFSALIPEKNLSLFPEPKYFLNRNLLVTGFLEAYRSQPQIIIYFPSQIKIINENKSTIFGEDGLK